MIEKINTSRLLIEGVGEISLTGSAFGAEAGFFDKLVYRGKRNVDGGALAALQQCEAKDFGGPVSSSSSAMALHRA